MHRAHRRDRAPSRLDVRLWNLFLPLAVAACGPGGLESGEGATVGTDDGGTDSETDAETGDETGDGCVDDTDCPTGQTCDEGECVPYYSTDGNYYDGNWYFSCYEQDDCGPGEVCVDYDCQPVPIPEECGAPIVLEALPMVEPGPPILAIAFTEHDGDANRELAWVDPTRITVFDEDGQQQVLPLTGDLETAPTLRSAQLDGVAGDDLVLLPATPDVGVAVFLSGPGGGLMEGAGSGPTAAFVDGAVADLDGDGLLDLAGLQDEGGGGRISVFAGDGFGGLGDPSALEGAVHWGVAVGQLDAGPFDDLVTSNGEDVQVWSGDAQAFAATLSDNYVPFEVEALLVADVDASGGADVLRLTSTISWSVVTEWYDGPAGPEPVEHYWTLTGDMRLLAVGDLDGDGWSDTVLGGAEGIAIRLGAQGCLVRAPYAASDGLDVGDFDGDGLDDIAVLSGGVVTILRASLP